MPVAVDGTSIGCKLSEFCTNYTLLLFAHRQIDRLADLTGTDTDTGTGTDR